MLLSLAQVKVDSLDFIWSVSDYTEVNQYVILIAVGGTKLPLKGR